LRDISLGLEYLHERKICHDDLKGINVLVEDSGRALLCDFGLARIKADITSRTRTASDTVISGSRNWMAPELLSGSLPRPPSGIYAFGMTLYELYTDEYPLGTISYGDFIELVFRIGVRPERPEEDECPRMTDGIWDLSERCWNTTPRIGKTDPRHDQDSHTGVFAGTRSCDAIGARLPSSYSFSSISVSVSYCSSFSSYSFSSSSHCSFSFSSSSFSSSSYSSFSSSLYFFPSASTSSSSSQTWYSKFWRLCDGILI
ncbi:kinase-like domain-containing protein, partial [Mycena sanguinolenta]